MAGTSPYPAWNCIDRRSSQLNHASSTPNSSYLLVSSTSFSASSPISLFLVHNSTIIAEHKVISSLSISPCDDHELTPSAAYTEYNIHRVQHTLSTTYTEYSIHRVQHTLSAAYSKYSIHRVQHTPCTAYTKCSIHQVQHPPMIVCLPFILLVMSWPLTVASSMPPYMIDCHQPAQHEGLNVKSRCHIPKFASQLTDELSLTTWRAFHWPPPSAHPS